MPGRRWGTWGHRGHTPKCSPLALRAQRTALWAPLQGCSGRGRVELQQGSPGGVRVGGSGAAVLLLRLISVRGRMVESSSTPKKAGVFRNKMVPVF